MILDNIFSNLRPTTGPYLVSLKKRHKQTGLLPCQFFPCNIKYNEALFTKQALNQCSDLGRCLVMLI